MYQRDPAGRPRLELLKHRRHGPQVDGPRVAGMLQRHEVDGNIRVNHALSQAKLHVAAEMPLFFIVPSLLLDGD